MGTAARWVPVASPDVATVRLRPEQPADVPAIRELLTAAFPPPEAAPTGPSPEANLVDELRTSSAWLPELAMVAETSDGLVGYALLTRVRVEPAGFPALALGPVAVSPARQGQGYGTSVVQAALEAATELGERLVVVLGEPAYYRRFGFVPAGQLGLTGPWSRLGDPWQALLLPGAANGVAAVPTGEVVYPEPWTHV